MPKPHALRSGLVVVLTFVALLGACRDDDPVAWIEADARLHLACEQVEVQYSGAYETLSPDSQVELYEVFSDCGGVATYRCETFDDGASTSTACCRFGDETCDPHVRR